jgi:hypothetical protein
VIEMNRRMLAVCAFFPSLLLSSCEAQLADFVTEVERLVNGAAERVIAQGSSTDAAPLRVRRGRSVPAGEPLEREFDVAAAGLTGDVRAIGLAFTRPWPARYDMAMLLAGFSRADVDGGRRHPATRQVS